MENERPDSGVLDQRVPRPHRLASILRPIAFHPIYVDICDGSINAALMLSQILYWTPRCGPEADGWFYKTRQQWFDELRLTRAQQDNARAILRERNFIEESLRACKAGTVKHFKANMLAIEDAIDDLRIPRSVCLKQANGPESGCLKQAEAIAENKQRNNERESTSETTNTLSSPSAPTEFVLDPNPPQNGKNNPQDPRHRLFTELIFRAHKHFLKDNEGNPVQPLFGPSAGSNLKKLLKSYPKLDEKKFRMWLTNYHTSENHNPYDSPAQFILKLPNYEGGPLNKFGRPSEAS